MQLTIWSFQGNSWVVMTTGANRAKVQWYSKLLIMILTYTVKTGSSAFIILTRSTITARVNEASKAALTSSCLNQRGTPLVNPDSSFSPD